MSYIVPNPAIRSQEDSASSLWDRIGILAGDIKLSHTVFAMPFALLAGFLAAAYGQRLPGVTATVLIVVCMVLARTVAMTINRWADAGLDVQNPRTADRAIPNGRLSAGFVLATSVICGIGFIVATGGFWVFEGNLYPLILSPFVLGWIAAYSFTKRFTWLCHLFLGSALAISPLAAAIAIEPRWLGRPGPYLLSTMVMFWVAGFDIIYALQDADADRRTGVYSMPARLGNGVALWISRAFHVVTLLALIGLWISTPLLQSGFASGVGIVAVLLIIEHALVWGSKKNRIHMAFFTVNGGISLLLGILGIVDVVRAMS